MTGGWRCGTAVRSSPRIRYPGADTSFGSCPSTARDRSPAMRACATRPADVRPAQSRSMSRSATQELSYADVLDRVLSEEVATKTARHVTMRTSLARFPFVKGLDSFGSRTPRPPCSRPLLRPRDYARQTHAPTVRRASGVKTSTAGTPPSRRGRTAHHCSLSGGTAGVSPARAEMAGDRNGAE